MSEKQHAKDLKDLKDKHKAVEEACLNRHISEFKESETCSHRGQAYKKAAGEGAGLYNFPAYKELVDRGKRVKTAADRGGKTVPSWYKKSLKAPEEGSWDVAGKNFKKKCYIPYWHESHHVVPNSTLRAAIIAAGQGAKSPSKLVLAIRGGLLDEGYNLNNEVNMIILPMDREVAMAIALPKHRRTPDHRSHSAYSKHVREQLKAKIFSQIRESTKKHDQPKYKKCRKKIESLSKRLYKAIIQAGKDMKEAAGKDDSLDDMEAKRFEEKSSKASKPGAKPKPKESGSKAGGRPG